MNGKKLLRYSMQLAMLKQLFVKKLISEAEYLLIVKWFDDKLGYGFIECKEVDKDVFVHFKEIKMKGFKTLTEGDVVEFDFDEDLGKAINVRVIQSEKANTNA